ncbi:hypothetical protein E2C01_025379 [Portunus trituberculatus]|uniref:Uncharacterized protein n=1 Tax=Portunus trituberculatus TaxID=210409 RepID=A0A5B7EFC3_PORTR|nr:hypothetical protein [Portunus trituberculatus]
MNYVRKYWATKAPQLCLPPRPPGADHDPHPNLAPLTPAPPPCQLLNISFNSRCFLLLPASNA